MNKLNLWISKTGRVSLDFNLESKEFEINYWMFQTWEEEKTGRAQDFDGPISIIIDSEIKEAEKKLQYYKYVLNNDYSVSYYENTDKIR
jgi:hypothetical protein